MSFSDIDDAVRFANSTEFGLCGSAQFGRRISRAVPQSQIDWNAARHG